MKTTIQTTKFLLPLLAICLLAMAGCKKAEPAATAVQYHGVNVDLPKLDTEFASAAPEVQQNLLSIKSFFRYAQFPQALEALDKLSNDPGLTEPQKKLLLSLIEQTKEVITKAPPEPAQ